MASRKEEKAELRQARVEVEQQEAAQARRRKLTGYVVAGVLSVALVAGIAVVIFAGDGDSSGASDTAFGQHYQGLEQRRLAANVPTMADGGTVHIHPRLAVSANGKEIPLPANIGIDPSQPPDLMAGLHTHDSSGVVHVEAGSGGATLGQFFEVWGVPFSKTRLGPYEATADKKVRVWVDGKPSERFGDLQLADGQRIVVAYGTEHQTPDLTR